MNLKRKFFYSVYGIIVLITLHTLIALFKPDWIMLICKLIFVSLLSLLILVLYLPAIKIKLGQSATSNLLTWALRIILSQIIFIMMTLQVIWVFFNSSPSFINQNEALIILANKVIDNQNHWPILFFIPSVLWGLSLTYFTYHCHRPPYHHNHAKNLYQGKIAVFTKAYIEMLVQVPTQIAFMIIIGSCIMGWALCLHWLINWPLFSEVPLLIALGGLVLFPLLHSEKSLKWVRQLSRYQWGLGIYVLITGLILFIWLITSTHLINFIPRQLIDKLPLQTGHWFKFVGETASNSRLLMFFWGWILIWTPLISSYYASISKGRRLFTFLIGTIIFPMIIQGLLLIRPNLLRNVFYMKSEITLFVTSTIIFMIIVALLFKVKNSSFMTNGFMRENQDFTLGRMSLDEATKIHGLSHYLRAFILGIISVIILQSTSGWYFIGMILGIFIPCLMYKTSGISIIMITQVFNKNVK